MRKAGLSEMKHGKFGSWRRCAISIERILIFWIIIRSSLTHRDISPSDLRDGFLQCDIDVFNQLLRAHTALKHHAWNEMRNHHEFPRSYNADIEMNRRQKAGTTGYQSYALVRKMSIKGLVQTFEYVSRWLTSLWHILSWLQTLRETGCERLFRLCDSQSSHSVELCEEFQPIYICTILKQCLIHGREVEEWTASQIPAS